MEILSGPNMYSHDSADTKEFFGMKDVKVEFGDPKNVTPGSAYDWKLNRNVVCRVILKRLTENGNVPPIIPHEFNPYLDEKFSVNSEIIPGYVNHVQTIQRNIKEEPAEDMEDNQEDPLGDLGNSDSMLDCNTNYSETSVTKTRYQKKKELYSCNICGKILSSLKYLKNHKLVHTDQRPFNCELCGMSFCLKVRLQNHMVVHTGKTKCKCGACGKILANSANLKIHMITHTGEKPYTCDICGQSFNLKGNLKKHRMKHSTYESVYSRYCV